MKSQKRIVALLCALVLMIAFIIPVCASASDLYQDGYKDGYERGLVTGRAEGRDAGYDSGYENGYAQGYGDGESGGFDAGYAEGIDVGRAEMKAELTFRQEREEKDRVLNAVLFTAAAMCGIFILILRFISRLIKKENARLQKKHQADLEILQRRMEAEQRKMQTPESTNLLRPAVPVRNKNFEEICRLKEQIAKMESTLEANEKTNRENMKILVESFTDRELEQMVARGEFPADRVEEYKEQRKCVEMVIAYAPTFRESTEKMIAQMRRELASLEADR